MTENAPDQAYRDSVQFLSRRDYGEKELRQRLRAKRHTDEAITAAFQRLQDQGYLDDQRSVLMHFRSAVRKGYGAQRVRQVLQQKGYASADIEYAFETEVVDWYELAETQWLKRFGPEPEKDARNQAKQQRYLYQRGFDADMIRQLLKVGY